MSAPGGDRRTARSGRAGDRPPRAGKPALRVQTTTLWEYPSREYDAWIEGHQQTSARGEQGDNAYAGATPAWVIWQLLMRYTREKDLVVDPMCGSGTTLDVARGLGRRGLGYDLAPTREDIFKADARELPLEDGVADFLFVDPPYSTHIDYSDDPRCIGKLDAAGEDGGAAYYRAIAEVLDECHRVMHDRRFIGVFVSDSWRKRKPGGVFMPIGFEVFSLLRERFRPVDVICVVRHNAKLKRGNWHKAAEEGNFFLRGFNYLLIGKKEGEPASAHDGPRDATREARSGKGPARDRRRKRGPRA